MKKIPTLFKRIYDNHKIIGITQEITSGMDWVLNGEGEATLKYDGSCCAIINGEYYKRYDAKKGKTPPAGAIPCGEPDPVTGHFPHWVKLDKSNPADKWFFKAFENAFEVIEPTDGTYEAIGKHFNGNPYNLSNDTVVKHGDSIIRDFPRTFDGMKRYLFTHYIEGVVFWKDGEPWCKIKRTDFGFKWNER